MAEQLNLISTLEAAKGNEDKILKFPNDLYDRHTDYVRFQFYKYEPPFANLKAAEKPDAEGKLGTSETELLQIYNQAGKGGGYTKFPGAPNIMMYMPEDIQAAYQTEWGGKGFSNVAANLLRTAGGALSGNPGSVIEGIKQSLGTAAGGVSTVAAEGLAEAVNQLGAGDVSGENILQGVSGVILNPNTELMFNGFKMRNFTLNFKMVPRNAMDSNSIRSIIYQFKRVMLPSLGTPGDDILNFFKTEVENPAEQPAEGDRKTFEDNNANYIGVPGLCQVKFMSGPKLHPFLPQYKVCAITDVAVNYTPDGTYATYGSGTNTKAGAPVAVTLAVTFQETKLVYRQDIRNSDSGSY